MRSKLVILGLFVCLFVVFSCKAQQILPLNTSAFGAVANSYFKDLSNEMEDESVDVILIKH
ncbi:hypothetical protein [Chryseobacterium sp. MYb328]|uniref:hypothetical protein n=1 Tax=Chryseobacterium sp. MYb328 TaxID=2745231 RepID=UPI00309F0B1C